LTLKYRPEIDGLRAIAVVAVVLYHAEISFLGADWLKGGYIGVDIFFVISGYLITGIIIKELNETGSFSFTGFYERRARRILPALFLVMTASIPLAWNYLLPKAFIDFAGSLLSSLLFASNFYFHFAGQEYAAESSLLKPLLHTWSLSVEEQFYIIFPIILIVGFKYFRQHLNTIFLVGIIASLLLAEWLSRDQQSLAFYTLPTRAWELLIGSMLALFETNGRRNNNPQLALGASALGLGLIVHALVFFDDTLRHPSLLTVSPIIGTSLIIWFARKGEPVTKLLSSPPFVGVGLISYSLYLWHYPIFAFSRITGSFETIGAQLGWISLSVVISVISFYAVEQPFRNRQRISRKMLTTSLTLCLTALLSINIVVIQFSGFVDRLPQILQADFAQSPWLIQKNEDNQFCYGDYGKSDFCLFEAKSTKGVILLIGDSTVGAISNELTLSANALGYDVIPMTSSRCYLLPGFKSMNGSEERRIPNEPCDTSYQEKRLKKIYEHPNATLVIGGLLDSYINGGNAGFMSASNPEETVEERYRETAEELLARNYRIIQLAPFPTTETMVGREVLKWIRSIEEKDQKAVQDFAKVIQITEPYGKFKQRNRRALRLLRSIDHPDFHLLYPHRLFCGRVIEDKCVFNDDENLFFVDIVHPSRKGARMISDQIIRKIQFLDDIESKEELN